MSSQGGTIMGYKIGGGDHLQYYDENDGQYADEDKVKILEKDKENLVLYHLFDMHYEHIVFHFPVCGIHDKEYCEMFVAGFRNRIKKINFDIRKAEYLLTPRDKDDKSKFLNGIGYDKTNQMKLKTDILRNIDFNKLEYSRLTVFGIKCSMIIRLNGGEVKTIWQINKDLSMHFVTLIPISGGKK